MVVCLDLRGCIGVNDGLFTAILSQSDDPTTNERHHPFEALEECLLSGSQITNTTILTLLQRCPRLSKFDVTNCIHLISVKTLKARKTEPFVIPPAPPSFKKKPSLTKRAPPIQLEESCSPPADIIIGSPPPPLPPRDDEEDLSLSSPSPETKRLSPPLMRALSLTAEATPVTSSKKPPGSPSSKSVNQKFASARALLVAQYGGSQSTPTKRHSFHADQAQSVHPLKHLQHQSPEVPRPERDSPSPAVPDSPDMTPQAIPAEMTSTSLTTLNALKCLPSNFKQVLFRVHIPFKDISTHPLLHSGNSSLDWRSGRG